MKKYFGEYANKNIFYENERAVGAEKKSEANTNGKQGA
jgi:hypothetical protein